MTPLTLVTGFLGSGKTTLIATLLRDPAFARTAVIVNEFGDVGIDHDLIVAGDDSVVTLATGCLCCAARGQIAETLLDLDRRREDGAVAFDRVLIETSGLADPAPALHTLMLDRACFTRFAPPRLVTVVDSALGARALSHHVEARQQVAFADHLIFSKCDLGPPGADLVAAVDALNQTAPRTEAAHGRIDPAVMFGIAGTALPATPPIARHTEGVTTITLERAAPLAGVALALWLTALVEHAGERLWRIKGLVDVAEWPGGPCIIQGVRHVIAAPTLLDAWPGGVRATRIVLIGERLPPWFAHRLLSAIEAEVSDETTRTGAAGHSTAPSQ